MPQDIHHPDGSFNFSGGVNSSKLTTVQSAANPKGLRRDQLGWMVNSVVRNGGITQRTGWQPLIPSLDLLGITGLFQGGFLYEPDVGNPYLIFAVGGNIYKALLEPPYTVTQLSSPGLTMPAGLETYHFEQAEMFLVIQANDGTTLPLFWDGATLRRSNGITGNIVGPNINEIPAAGPMCYYAGRLWYAQGRNYIAGDIVDNRTSGTAPYGFRDSVLKVTENPLAGAGDGFNVPSGAGDIRALSYPSNLNTQLGQGPLLVFTRKMVFALTVPANRADWIAANASNKPNQVVVQKKWGAVGDRCITHVNGDVFYQTMEPGIRSLQYSIRNFTQWANTSLSANVNRIMARNDRSIARFASGIEFDNRLWQTVAPFNTPRGVASRATVNIDFNQLGTMDEEEKGPPVWEGHYQGIPLMQLYEGDFGGRQRAFGITFSDIDASLGIWELTNDSRTEDGDKRVVWQFETPAFTWADTIGETDWKRLVGGEILYDKIFGTVECTVEYRPDADACWHFWHKFEMCSARDQYESGEVPLDFAYPVQEFRESYNWPVSLPKPPIVCQNSVGRPSDLGYQFQMRVTIKGWMRVRGFVWYADAVEHSIWKKIICPPTG